MCHRAASRLDIPWPEAAKETSRSRYEGKNLPQAARTKRQLLPVFPKMLDEVSVSWRDRPFSNKAPIQGASSLDCDGMERLGLLRMPPMEPLVAAHLQPRLASTPSRNPMLPAKADWFQSAMTEWAYKAAAFSARALNVSSLLTAYQAELCEDMSSRPEPAVWDKIAAITDICLRVQRCAVQATGKSLGMMVSQERARWLNLTNLPDREKRTSWTCQLSPRAYLAPLWLQCSSGVRLKRRRMRLSSFVFPKSHSPPRVSRPDMRRGRAGQESPRFRQQPHRHSRPRPSAIR